MPSLSYMSQCYGGDGGGNKKNSEPEKVDSGEGVCIRQGGKDLRDGGG
jgi:hypothetical protein